MYAERVKEEDGEGDGETNSGIARYVNNFYPETFHSTCMSWTWYLANDMQFFVLGLLLLKINLKSVRVGVVLCVAFSIGGVVTGWLLLLKHRGNTQDDYYDKVRAHIPTASCVSSPIIAYRPDKRCAFHHVEGT